MDKPALPGWPRLLDLKLSGAYLSVGTRVVEDWIHEGLLDTVPMPGSTLKDKSGNVIAPAGKRRIAKILIDRADLDALIERKKAGNDDPQNSWRNTASSRERARKDRES